MTAFLEASVEAMLIVNPETQKIEHKNSNGNELLSNLITEGDDRPVYELFPGWDYLDELKKWHEEGSTEPIKMETSLLDKEGKDVFLEVNTTKKYGKWLITFQNITQRKLAEKDLKREKRLSDTIINALPSHFYMFDEDMNFIRWNKNIVETTGRTDEELVDLSPADFFEGEDIQRVSEYVERTMNGFEGSIQADLVMKDGSKEPYLFHATAFENSGKKYFLGTGQSVAEQVEYQSSLKNLIHEKEVLLQEVHHRVKNNLAVISGFLQLQELISEHKETKTVLLSNYMRVKSMALIHDELYKANDFTGIDFELYMTEMLAMLKDKLSPPEKSIKLHVNSESIYMNLNQAVPLALIVNELVSNAYTYAFNGKEHGNVWVRLKLKGDHISLSIEDDGIGLPENFNLEESPTLGTTLVMSYSDQINADIKVTSENGTHYELKFFNNTAKSGSNVHTAV